MMSKLAISILAAVAIGATIHLALAQYAPLVPISDGPYGGLGPYGGPLGPPPVIAGVHHPSHYASPKYAGKRGKEKEEEDNKDKRSGHKESDKHKGDKEVSKGAAKNKDKESDYSYDGQPHRSPYRPSDLYGSGAGGDYYGDDDTKQGKKLVDKEKDKGTTAAPGAWGSFSNSMSDAWRRFSVFGSEPRSAKRARRDLISASLPDVDNSDDGQQQEQQQQQQQQQQQVVVNNETGAVPQSGNITLVSTQQQQQQKQQQEFGPLKLQEQEQQQQQVIVKETKLDSSAGLAPVQPVVPASPSPAHLVYPSRSPLVAALATSYSSAAPEQVQSLTEAKEQAPSKAPSIVDPYLSRLSAPSVPSQSYVYLKVPRHLICAAHSAA